MYINIDPSTSEGQSFLGQHFINQCAPDMGQKLQKLQSGPQMPMPQLLHVAFEVFNNRDQAQGQSERARKSNHSARGKTNEGECYKCKSTGHWAQDCQKEFPGPCPACQQTGHWKRGCLQS